MVNLLAEIAATRTDQLRVVISLQICTSLAQYWWWRVYLFRHSAGMMLSSWMENIESFWPPVLMRKWLRIRPFCLVCTRSSMTASQIERGTAHTQTHQPQGLPRLWGNSMISVGMLPTMIIQLKWRGRGGGRRNFPDVLRFISRIS
jgi:hypothetical protein